MGFQLSCRAEIQNLQMLQVMSWYSNLAANAPLAVRRNLLYLPRYMHLIRLYKASLYRFHAIRLAETLQLSVMRWFIGKLAIIKVAYAIGIREATCACTCHAIIRC